MTYDRLVESLRLIESGLPPDTDGLSRRRRFVPLAVDVDGAAAATVFARRGAGTDVVEAHVLYRHGDTWALHGGGTWPIGSDEFSRSWAPDRGEPRARFHGRGAVNVGARRRTPWRARWVHYTWLQLADDVRKVAVDSRLIDVPWHGHVVVVRAGDRARHVTLLGDEGTALGEIDLDRPGGAGRHRR